MGETISKAFNKISLGGFLKFAFQAIVIGLIVGGLFDFTLFHEHPLGEWLLDMFREPLLSFYDGVAEFIGHSELVRPEEFVGSTGGEASSTTGSAASGGDEVVEGACGLGVLDPVTMAPVPC